MQKKNERRQNAGRFLDAAVVTDIGNTRAVNEDNFYFNGLICPQSHSSVAYSDSRINADSCPMFAVFDGMGGYSAGERASFLTAETARLLFLSQSDRNGSQLLRLCTEANEAVCNEMTKSGQRTGSTASMLLLDSNGGYSICNIGDSPVLLIRDGIVREISKEHTERELFEKVTGKRADPHRKFRLTQHIGIFPEELEIEPYFHEDTVHDGDVFLICSDGLTDMVSYEEILHVAGKSLTAEEIVNSLCAMAKNAGGRDNITIICIKVLKNAPAFRI